MSTFSLLFPELRYNILEHVVLAATAPLNPPNVDETDPKDWRPCKVFKRPAYYARAEAPAYLQWAQCPTARLLPYLLVSKTFQQDIQHVWTRYVAPTLFPVLSMSLVGPDRNRAMKGTLVSWLTPLPTSPNITRIEWQFRFYDQKPNATGHSSLKRSYEDGGTTFDLTLVNVFEKSFLRDWYGLQPFFTSEDSGGFGYWVFRLSTEVDPDVHLASSELFEVTDPELKIMPHPYRETSDLKDHLDSYIEFDLLTGAEIWVDDKIVYRATPRTKAGLEGIDFGTPDHPTPHDGICDVIREEFEYTMPVDPLLIPRPAPVQADSVSV